MVAEMEFMHGVENINFHHVVMGKTFSPSTWETKGEKRKRKHGLPSTKADLVATVAEC